MLLLVNLAEFPSMRQHDFFPCRLKPNRINLSEDLRVPPRFRQAFQVARCAVLGRTQDQLVRVL
jgi:hypothetical protein